MIFKVLYTVVVRGNETKHRAALTQAQHTADKLRNIHGKYNVWLRPHAVLVAL